MRRLTRHVVGIFVVLLFMDGAAILIGQRQPLPAQLDMLYLDRCILPCWVGIIPGQTTLGQAETLIRQTFPASRYTLISNDHPSTALASFNLTDRYDGASVAIRFNEGEATNRPAALYVVSHITLESRYPSTLMRPAAIGDWYALFGDPQHLGIYCDYNAKGRGEAVATLLYDQQTIQLTLDTAHTLDVADAYREVSRIDIYAQSIFHSSSSVMIPWQGLKTANHDLLYAAETGE